MFGFIICGVAGYAEFEVLEKYTGIGFIVTTPLNYMIHLIRICHVVVYILIHLLMYFVSK